MVSTPTMRSRTESQQLRRLNAKVTWQRVLFGIERIWQAMHGLLLVAGIAFATIASGLLLNLPQYLQAAALLLLALLFIAALKPLFFLPWPERVEAMRHLERSASIEHRAISSLPDQVAAEILNPAADAMWDEHRRRQLAGLENIKVVPPRSHWRRLDPHALRVPVLLACLASYFLGSNDPLSNLQQSARLMPAPPAVPLTMDAWLKPPAYTGRPPVLLTGQQMAERLASAVPVEIPENATFALRLSGAENPGLSFLDMDGKTPLADISAKTALKEEAFTAEALVSRPLTIVVTGNGQELARWPIATIPDQPPALSLTEAPTSDSRGNLTLKWKVADDYGVRKLEAEIALADEQDGGTGFESNGVFLFDPPQLKPALRRTNGKEEAGTSRFGLAKHPWAGLQVTLDMAAIDGAGQTGTIAPVTFRMPERVFVKPLPRALIEQRKQLIIYPERAVHTGTLIDALALYPKGQFEGAAPVIAMAAIASRLRNAAGHDDVSLAIDMLWDLAVALEEGALADARAELQALKNELEKALREGAPPERIAELMKKLREAMNRLLDAMREEAERRIREGSLQPLDPNQKQNGRMLSQEDLQKMLDALEELSRNGANDMAQQLLEELNELLQNLQPGIDQQSADGQGDMEEMMRGLGDLMRRQQRLMDETQRMPGRAGRPGEQGDLGDGEEGEGDKTGEGGDLAERQRELRRMLDEMRGRGKGPMPDSLEGAGEDMEGAAGALREGDREGALQEQGQALEKLRRGAQELAERLREQGQGQTGNQALDAEGRGGEDDPLGRPRATRNPDDGPREDIVPTERALQRAREILETLRSKANERGLSDTEKAYIERLLRGLY